MNVFAHNADDFYVNMNLNTELELPSSRDTVLHFFEQLRKAFPDLDHLLTREGGELVLEGDKDAPSHRWVGLEPRRLCSGHANPEEVADAYRLHGLVLELAPHLLTLSPLDCEALDVSYAFDFNYAGNHDDLVAEVLGVGTGMEPLLEVPRSRVLNFEPSITLALDPACKLQCRCSIETRTSTYQIRTGEFPDEQISVYFTVRQYWGSGAPSSFVESFARQCAIGEQIVAERVLPRIVVPLAQAIASK